MLSLHLIVYSTGCFSHHLCWVFCCLLNRPSPPFFSSSSTLSLHSSLSLSWSHLTAFITWIIEDVWILNCLQLHARAWIAGIGLENVVRSSSSANRPSNALTMAHKHLRHTNVYKKKEALFEALYKHRIRARFVQRMCAWVGSTKGWKEACWKTKDHVTLWARKTHLHCMEKVFHDRWYGHG